MPFMVHSELKANSLNSCPGERNCWECLAQRTKGHISEEYFFQQEFHILNLSAKKLYSLMCTGK